MYFLKSIKSEKELDIITEPIAKNLANGDIIFLEGALASGKTTCIREIIKSVSLIKKKSFSFQGSPTYQKANTYDFKNLNILHFDFYNLKQNDQNDLEDYIIDNSILMEWPSKNMNEKYNLEALFISISIQNNVRIFKLHTHSIKWLKIIKSI
mgnify:FL=1